MGAGLRLPACTAVGIVYHRIGNGRPFGVEVLVPRATRRNLGNGVSGKARVVVPARKCVARLAGRCQGNGQFIYRIRRRAAVSVQPPVQVVGDVVGVGYPPGIEVLGPRPAFGNPGNRGSAQFRVVVPARKGIALRGVAGVLQVHGQGFYRIRWRVAGGVCSAVQGVVDAVVYGRPFGPEIPVPHAALFNPDNFVSAQVRFVAPALKGVPCADGGWQGKGGVCTPVVAGVVHAAVKAAVIQMVRYKVCAVQVRQCQGIGLFTAQTSPHLYQVRHHGVEVAVFIQPDADIVIPGGILASKDNCVRLRRNIADGASLFPNLHPRYPVTGRQVDG